MTEASSSSFGGASPFSRRDLGRLASIITVLVCFAAAGCGGSSRAAPKVPAPQRVCTRAEQAARGILGQVVMKITDSDPANIECVLEGSGIRVDAVAQAATQAWTEYDTAIVHQVQAFAGTANGRRQIPQDVSIRGSQASWIPAENELVATNGTESTAGSYVTVTIAGRAPSGTREVTVAQSVVAAVLAVAPRGASPGPPPS